jgi:hypothetical protein
MINHDSFRREKKVNSATPRKASVRDSSSTFLIDVYKKYYYIVSSEISALYSIIVAPSTREKRN